MHYSFKKKKNQTIVHQRMRSIDSYFSKYILLLDEMLITFIKNIRIMRNYKLKRKYKQNAFHIYFHFCKNIGENIRV